MKISKKMKLFLAFWLTGTYLYSVCPKPLTEFERAHKDEIILIIRKNEEKYGDNYLAQKYWIDQDIQSLKELEEIKAQYGIKE